MAKKQSSPEKRLAGCLDQMDASEQSCLHWSIEAGKILNEQKLALKYGGWEDWLKDNWKSRKSARTARICMQLANADQKKIANAVSVRDAQRMISQKRQRAAEVETDTTREDGETNWAVEFASLISDAKRIVPNVSYEESLLLRSVIDSIHPPKDVSLICITEDSPFEQFWKAYPPTRKRDKPKAEAIFNKAIKKTDALLIIRAAAEFAQSPEGLSEFCPGPVPWLNGGRWMDDREAWNRSGSNGPTTYTEQRTKNTAGAVQRFIERRNQQKIEAK